MQGQTHSLEKTLEFSNLTARIFRPVLTSEERTRRMKAIHNASAELLKKTESKKTEKGRCKQCHT